MDKQQAAFNFFFEHAGYSYKVETESGFAGRTRCANDLVLAEARADDAGFSFEWDQDDITSEEFSDERPFYHLWRCAMKDEDGETLASLGGIDFGRDVEPWGQDYTRVVEAELACEHTFTREAEMQLLFDGNRGIYIPKNFAEEMRRDCVTGVTDEDYAVLESGPDHEWYWDTWDDVLNNAVISEPSTGKEFTLHQDGDVWLIELGAEWDEDTDTYFVEL